MALSDHLLRDKVHTELAALLNGGQLAVAPQRVQEYLADPLVIARAARQYREQYVGAPTRGHCALITAGVPGAGKSTLIDSIAAGYRRIDPDKIKDVLLAELEDADLIDVRHQHFLSDGMPVSPGELAGWVHNASTAAADQVRLASLQLGENFVMEGTLSWPPLSDSHVDELAAYGFERLTVLDVEVPLSVAVEQSKRRWWSERYAGRTVTDGVGLGGRYISESVLSQYYSGEARVAECAANARRLYRNAGEAGLESELIVVTRTAGGDQYAALLSCDDVAPWRGEPLGAACTHCGDVLTEPHAIMSGVGADHL